jgi:hypothetical protein
MTKEGIERLLELREESSMLNWWPKVCGILPAPTTEIVEFTQSERRAIWEFVCDQIDGEDGPGLSSSLWTRVIAGARVIGFPLFMRTDQASAKHEWKDTCHVPDEAALMGHMINLLMWHSEVDMMGLPWQALVFRRLLPLKAGFTAFNGLPIAVERRYFVRDGSVICHHVYWPNEAISQDRRNAYLIPSWMRVLNTQNTQSTGEVEFLTRPAERFSDAVPGFWSVDFAQDQSDAWWLIDAGRGEISWHPKDCRNYEHLEFDL